MANEFHEGHPLSRQVAQLIGYRVVTGHKNNHNYADLFSPDGKWINRYWASSYRDYPKAAWANTPNYALHADDALTLTVDGYALSINQDFDGWYAVYNTKTDGFISQDAIVCERGETAAVAICKARLALEELVKIESA
jgi:hypothetical protein